MKKQYKLSIKYDDEVDEVDSLSGVLKEIDDPEEEGIWLDTGDKTVLLPAEFAKYLEETGILGLA